MVPSFARARSRALRQTTTRRSIAHEGTNRPVAEPRFSAWAGLVGAAVGALFLPACGSSHDGEGGSHAQTPVLGVEPDEGSVMQAQAPALEGERDAGSSVLDILSLFDGGCTLAGCVPTVTIRTSLPDSVAAIRALSLEVCRNDECNTADFAALEQVAGGSLSAIVSYGGSSSFVNSSVWLTVSQESGRYELSASWRPPASSILQDGDHFRVTLREPSGKAWRFAEESVTYARFYPNGDRCDPGCQVAEINTFESGERGQ